MHLQREYLKLLGHPARELGGSVVMAGTRRVLGPEIVKAALRNDLHDRQRTVVQDRNREFPTVDVLLDQRRRAVSKRRLQRCPQAPPFPDDGDPECRTLTDGLDHQGKLVAGREGSSPLAEAPHEPARHRQPAMFQQALRHRLVHRHGAGLDPRPGIGHPQHFEHSLDRAVLAARPMQRDERDLRPDFPEARDHGRVHFQRNGVVALPDQRRPDRPAAAERDLPLGGQPSHQHRDALGGQQLHARPTIFTSSCSVTPVFSSTVWPTLRISASTSRAVARPRFTMKLAWSGETCASPTWAPFRPAVSMSEPAGSPSGFLKTQPAFGSASGCVAFLRCNASFTVASLRALGSHRSRSHAPTTMPSGRRVRRYSNPTSSADSSRISPNGVTIRTCCTTSFISPKRVPAFMTTAPASVPGMPAANSSPASLRWRACLRSRGIPTPPCPYKSPPACPSTRPNLVSRTTIPRMPPSRTKRLVPPMTKTGTFALRACTMRSRSASSSSGSINASAGPPIRKDVYRRMGSWNRTIPFTPDRADRISRMPILLLTPIVRRAPARSARCRPRLAPQPHRRA